LELLREFPGYTLRSLYEESAELIWLRNVAAYGSEYVEGGEF
jgi:hypothetical protein